MACRTYIVEDNAIVLNGLVDALVEVAPVSVVGSAPSAGSAIAWLAANQASWDLMILDLFLQGSSGLEVLQECRRRRPGQRVIVLTNYATREIRRRCVESGADAVFDKSTELEELFAYFSAQAGASSRSDGFTAE